MRIEGIRLVNFRSHERTELRLEDVTFVLGANGAGKSSVADAVEWLLTGRNQHTDAAGRNAKGIARLAPSGAGQGFGVEAKVDGVVLARRVSGASTTLTRDGHPVQEFVFEVADPITNLKSQITKKPIAKDVLSAVLNSGRFLSLADKEQRALLAQVLDSGSVDVPQERIEDIALVDGVKVERLKGQKVNGVEDCEQFHKRFYDERTVVGRQLKEAEAAAGSAPEVPEGMAPPERVQEQLDDRRALERRLVKQRAERTAAFDAGQRLRRELEEKKARLEADTLANADEQQCIEASTKAGEIREWVEKRDELALEAVGVERILSALLALRGKCPTCIRKITAAEQAELGNKLKEELEELRSKVEKLNGKIAKYGDPGEAETKLRKHRTAAAELVKLEREMAKLPSESAEGVDTADLDAQLADLAQRIRKGEAALEASREQLRAVKAYHDAEKRVTTLRAKHEACGRLVEYFGPSGVRAKLAEGRLPEFGDKLNLALEKFGFGCAVVLEPFYRLIVSTPAGLTLEAGQLSESEQFRFGVALQIALAQVTGVGLVVVDRADVLDKATRRGLNAMLMDAARLGIKSLVLATSTEDLPVTAPEGVKFYGLEKENGTSRAFTAEDVEGAALHRPVQGTEAA